MSDIVTRIDPPAFRTDGMNMITVALPTFKAHPDDYLKHVEAGEDLLIRPASTEVGPATVTKRPFGLDAGKFVVPDDFNDPLPEDLLRLFEGDEE